MIKVPQILLPKPNADWERWSTVACDQYTSEPKYWQNLDAYVGKTPSTLRLTYPEAFIKDLQPSDVSNIAAKMREYENNGFFRTVEGIILVERQIGTAKRFGIICAIDLEDYDFNRVRKPIRSTEGTILSRLPVRVDIRRVADIELPHAMLLIDDAEKSVIEPLVSRRDTFEKLYDFDLNMNGGNIKGYLVDDAEGVIRRIEALGEPSLQVEKYGKDAGIMLAVGDGNHSVAAAKVYWEEVKATLTQEEIKTHPARFALVEVVNIYGGGMEFEPIHRIIWHPSEVFTSGLAQRLLSEGDNGNIEILCGGESSAWKTSADSAMVITAVQQYIEDAIQTEGLEVDYIHGRDHLEELVKSHQGSMGIVMPAFPAGSLFDYVVNVGNLPKKAFSIGRPYEKRYYLEARRIK